MSTAVAYLRCNRTLEREVDFSADATESNMMTPVHADRRHRQGERKKRWHVRNLGGGGGGSERKNRVRIVHDIQTSAERAAGVVLYRLGGLRASLETGCIVVQCKLDMRLCKLDMRRPGHYDL